MLLPIKKSIPLKKIKINNDVVQGMALLAVAFDILEWIATSKWWLVSKDYPSPAYICDSWNFEFCCKYFMMFIC